MPTYHDPRDPHEDEVRCSFCGKTRSQVRKLVQGPEGVFICDECIDACSDIIRDSDAFDSDVVDAYGDVPTHAAPSPLPIDDLPTPHQIYDELSQYVMGQEDAKRAMSVAVYNHYRRVLYGLEDEQYEQRLRAPRGQRPRGRRR